MSIYKLILFAACVLSAARLFGQPQPALTESAVSTSASRQRRSRTGRAGNSCHAATAPWTWPCRASVTACWLSNDLDPRTSWKGRHHARR